MALSAAKRKALAKAAEAMKNVGDLDNGYEATTLSDALQKTRKFFFYVFRIPHDKNNLNTYPGEWIDDLRFSMRYKRWDVFVDVFVNYFEELCENGIFKYPNDEHEQIMEVLSDPKGFEKFKDKLMKKYDLSHRFEEAGRSMISYFERFQPELLK